VPRKSLCCPKRRTEQSYGFYMNMQDMKRPFGITCCAQSKQIELLGHNNTRLFSRQTKDKELQSTCESCWWKCNHLRRIPCPGDKAIAVIDRAINSALYQRVL